MNVQVLVSLSGTCSPSFVRSFGFKTFSRAYGGHAANQTLHAATDLWCAQRSLGYHFTAQGPMILIQRTSEDPLFSSVKQTVQNLTKCPSHP